MPEIAIPVLNISDSTVLSDEFCLGAWEGKPLRWRILSLEGSRATVLSVSAVCQQAFNDAPMSVTWEDSSLRAWLNGPFVEGAFSQQEVESLVVCPLENQANPDYQTACGGSTNDRVFCLSCAQVDQLLSVESRRALEAENGLWWLRTSGGTGEFAAYVHNTGWVNTYGYNVDEPHVSVRPALVIDFSVLLPQVDFDSVVRSSEYGEELLLEVMETGDLSGLSQFVQVFGVDESWESFVVETVEGYAEEGDAAAIEDLFGLFGNVEYLSGALQKAIGCGHATAARALIRHGARLDGRCLPVELINDTPELKKLRKASYGADAAHYGDALDGEGAGHAIRLLMNQEALKPSDYRGLLYAAAAREDSQDLYQWMLCPDREPIGGLKARWSGKRVSIVRGGMHRDVPVSAEGLRRLWHQQLCHDDPETVRVMAPYLGYRDLDGKGALLNLLAQEGWNRELSDLLGIYKMFSISQLSEAVTVAKRNKHKDTAGMLLDLLRSIGAGKIAQELE